MQGKILNFSFRYLEVSWKVVFLQMPEALQERLYPVFLSNLGTEIFLWWPGHLVSC